MKERGLVQYLSSLFSSRSNNDNITNILGIGDDACLIKSDHPLVFTTDAMSYSCHVFNFLSDQELGKRFVTANVSDLASMGASPKFFLNNILINESNTDIKIKNLIKGIEQGCSQYEMSVIGGDISSGKELILSGFAIGFIEDDKYLTRSEAQANDLLCVTGDLGKVKLGFEMAESSLPKEVKEKMVSPKAKVKEGKELVGIATSCDDISDGLSNESWEISLASDVKLVLDPDKFPIADIVYQNSENPIETALSSGEEFEILFTAPSDQLKSLEIDYTIIGKVKKGSGVYLKDGTQVPRTGWEHFNKE